MNRVAQRTTTDTAPMRFMVFSLRQGMAWMAGVALMGALGCVRVVTPDGSRGTEPPVEVDRLELDSIPMDGGPGVLLGYGGNVLRINGRGFDPALAEARLEGTPLRRAQEPGGPMAMDGGGMMSGASDGGSVLVVALPPNKLEGRVVVVQGARLGTSTQVVKVLGAGHPERPEYSGTTDPQFSIVRAGTRPLYCPPEQLCEDPLSMPGALAVAFAVSSGVISAPLFHVAVVGLFGLNDQLGAVGQGDVMSTVSQLWPFDSNKRRRGVAGSGVGLHRFGLSGQGEYISEVRSVSPGPPRDGGILENAQPLLFPVGANAGLALLASADKVIAVVNGFPILGPGNEPLRLDPPNAVGATHPGQYPPPGSRPDLLWLECPAVDGGSLVTMRHLDYSTLGLGQDGGGVGITSRTTFIPRAPADGGVCDLLGPGASAACRSLAAPDVAALEACAQDTSDGGCCDLRNGLARCFSDRAMGGCQAQLEAASVCYDQPNCMMALDNCRNNNVCVQCNNNPLCALTRACVSNADCAATLACANIDNCVAGIVDDQPAGCTAFSACQGDDNCLGHAECHKNNCAGVNACLDAICQTPEGLDAGYLLAKVGYLTPLDAQQRLFVRNAGANEVIPPVDPVCTIPVDTGVPRLLLEDALSTASATELGGHSRVMSVLGASRTLVLQDLVTNTFGLAPTRTRYRQLQAANVGGLVFAVPETGPRVDLLSPDGVVISSFHVLGVPTAAYPLPASDGRILSFHNNHVVLADNAGNVMAMRFYPQSTFTAEPPSVAGATPSTVWALVPDETDTLVLTRTTLDLTPRPPGDFTLGSDDALGRVDATQADLLAALVGVYRDTLYLLQCGDDACESTLLGRMPAGAPDEVLTVTTLPDLPPGFLMAVDGREGVALWLKGQGDAVEASLLLNLTNDTTAVVHPREQGTTDFTPFAAVPAPGGGFVAVGVVVDGMSAARLVVGWITPGSTGVLDILAPVESLESSVTVSPDGQRVYVGHTGRITEFNVAEDRSVTPTRHVATGTRAIAIDGRPVTMAMDAEGTRLVYTDWETQTVGLVE